jgi:hypothetical protein
MSSSTDEARLRAQREAGVVTLTLDRLEVSLARARVSNSDCNSD